MAVDELKPGMKGIGKTVFSGTDIEEFQVEVLGVLKNVKAKGDIILVRISGGPLSKTGIIAGMSGSPIYIDGKLIGALAFAWPFSKEPIGGVTPIHDMLSVFESRSEPSDTGSKRFLQHWNGLSPNYNNHEEKAMVAATIGQDNQAYQAGQAMVLRPLQTPVMFTGFDTRVINKLAPVLSQFGLIPAQSGGSGSTGSLSQETAPVLSPGAAIAVQLIRGDLDVSAIGTLTYRAGDRILAFGHPMLFAGATDLPLAGAYIHTILPSQWLSLKLASSTKMVGLISQDRMTGIAGEIGAFAELIPFHMEIKTARSEEPLQYNFEVIDNKLLAPLLMQGAAESAILSTGSWLGDNTIKLWLEIVVKDRPPIVIENVFSSPTTLSSAVNNELTVPIKLLMTNVFEEVKIERVSLRASIEEKRRTADISRVMLSITKVKPGETVELMIIISPFGEDYVTKKVKLIVPEYTPAGTILIRVSDAITARESEKERAPDKFKPKSLAQLINLIEEQNRNIDVIIRLVVPRGGAVIAGEELAALPSSVLAVMQHSKETGRAGEATKETNLVEIRMPTEWVISTSSYKLALTVES